MSDSEEESLSTVVRQDPNSANFISQLDQDSIILHLPGKNFQSIETQTENQQDIQIDSGTLNLSSILLTKDAET